MSPTKVPDTLQIQGIPRDIGGVGTHHPPGVWAQGPGKVLIVDVAHFVGGKDGQLQPLLLQTIQRAQYRVVLQGGGDDVVPRAVQATDGGVQRHCRVWGEADPGGVCGPQQLRHRLPAGPHSAGGRQRQRMGSPTWGAHRVHGIHHRLGHTGWLQKGGGRRIQIDHGLTPPPAGKG